MIAAPLGDEESDLENENVDSLCVDDLPNEVSCKLEVLAFTRKTFLAMPTAMMTMLKLLLYLHERK